MPTFGEVSGQALTGFGRRALVEPLTRPGTSIDRISDQRPYDRVARDLPILKLIEPWGTRLPRAVMGRIGQGGVP